MEGTFVLQWSDAPDEPLDEFLDRLGSGGWELVSTFPTRTETYLGRRTPSSFLDALASDLTMHTITEVEAASQVTRLMLLLKRIAEGQDASA
jgi:hypothetical protein